MSEAVQCDQPTVDKKADDCPTKEEEQSAIFVGFARVFSGTLRKGEEIFVLGPKYHPSMKKEAIDISLTLEVFRWGI